MLSVCRAAGRHSRLAKLVLAWAELHLSKCKGIPQVMQGKGVPTVNLLVATVGTALMLSVCRAAGRHSRLAKLVLAWAGLHLSECKSIAQIVQGESGDCPGERCADPEEYKM